MKMSNRSFWLIAPYAVWLALMMLLPSTAVGYAVRAGAVALLLLGSALAFVPFPKVRFIDAMIGLIVGLAVFAIWILPEQFNLAWYQKFCIVGGGGTEAIAEASGVMIVIRLLGSALVIPAAEEMFFRKWMIGFAGFWWMVVLFAVEHNRYAVGAIAGVIYGLIYLRRGLFTAILAHSVTNLVLGLWVIRSGQWQFW